MTLFPWLLCPLLGCMLTVGGKTTEWRHPYPPRAQTWVAVVMRPCVEEMPPFPLTERVETKIEYKLQREETQ